MESTLKRTWEEISLDNLAHNFETIRRQVGPKATLLGVVKADASGHGAVRVAKHLERLGAGYLAVSNLDECEELRVNGITLPILMLGFTPADQAERILKNDMTQAVPNLAIAEAYSSAAVRAGGTMKVHIKLDTGMGRLGFQCDDAHFDASLRDILKILTLPGLDVEGVFTHFCVSDEAADECVEFTKIQHDRFLRMIDVTDLPQLKVGDEIEVFGEHPLIETAAKQCGTISYELLCAVSKRVPRYYYLGGKCVDRNLQLLG